MLGLRRSPASGQVSEKKTAVGDNTNRKQKMQRALQICHRVALAARRTLLNSECDHCSLRLEQITLRVICRSPFFSRSEKNLCTRDYRIAKNIERSVARMVEVTTWICGRDRSGTPQRRWP